MASNAKETLINFFKELSSNFNSEGFHEKLKEQGVELKKEIVDGILELKKEVENNQLDDKALEFLVNLFDLNTHSISDESALEGVAGGNKVFKKILAASLSLGGLASAPGMLNGSVSALTPEEIAQYAEKGKDENFLKLPIEDQVQVIQAMQNLNRFQYYRETNELLEHLRENDIDKYNALQAKAVTALANDAQEGLARSAHKALPIVAAVLVVKYAGDILNHLKNFYAASSNALKNWFYRMTYKGIDVAVYKTVIDRIEKRLRAELVGQDEAIDRIVTLLTGYFESVVQAKALNKKFEGGLVLYLTGMPATGKTTAMKIIEQEMGLKAYFARMSDAIEDKGNGAQTVASRLTKPVIQDNGQTKISVDTPLTKQLKTGVPTLYCFDEVDKMRIHDSVLQNTDMKNLSGQIRGGSVDEMIRNFGDTGQINSINASGSILIATSNETQDDLRNLEESLYNRYKGLNIHFKSFNASDYKEIIRRKSQDILKFYKDKHNIDIVFDTTVLDHYSTKFEKENSGGRAVDVLMNDVRAQIKFYQERHKENFKDITLSVNYANANGLHVK